MASQRRLRRVGGECKFENKPQFIGLVAADESGLPWIYVGKMFAPSPIYGMDLNEVKQGFRPVQVRRPGSGPLKLDSGECGFAIVHPSRLVQLSGSFTDADIGRAIEPATLQSTFCSPPAVAKGVSLIDVKLLAQKSTLQNTKKYSKPLLLIRQPCTLSKFSFTS